MKNAVFVFVAVACLGLVFAGDCASHPLHTGSFKFTYVDEPGKFYGSIVKDSDGNDDVYLGSYTPATYATKTLDYAELPWLTTATTQTKAYTCANLLNKESCCNQQTYEQFLAFEYDVLDKAYETTLQYRTDIGYAYDTMRRFAVGVNRVMDTLVDLVDKHLGDTIVEWSNGKVDPEMWKICTEVGAEDYWKIRYDRLNTPNDPNSKDPCEKSTTPANASGSYDSVKLATIPGTTPDQEEYTAVDNTSCPSGFESFIADMFDRLFGVLCSIEAFVNALSDAFEVYLAGLISGLEQMDLCTKAVGMYHAGLLCDACDPTMIDDPTRYNNGTIRIANKTTKFIADYCRAPVIDVPLFIIREFMTVFADTIPDDPKNIKENEKGKFSVVGMINTAVTYLADAFKGLAEDYNDKITTWNTEHPDIIIQTTKDYITNILLTKAKAINGWSAPLINLNMYEPNGGIFSATSYLYTVPFAWLKFYEKMTGFTIAGNNAFQIIDVLLGLSGNDTLDIRQLPETRIVQYSSYTLEGKENVQYIPTCADGYCSMKRNRDGECVPQCAAVNTLSTIASEKFEYSHKGPKEVTDEDDDSEVIGPIADEVASIANASSSLQGTSVQKNQQEAVMIQMREAITVQGVTIKTEFATVGGIDAIAQCDGSCIGECGCNPSVMADIPSSRNTTVSTTKKQVGKEESSFKDVLLELLGCDESQLPIILGAAAGVVILSICICICCCCRRKAPVYGGYPMMGGAPQMAPMGMGMAPSMGGGFGGPPMGMQRGMSMQRGGMPMQRGGMPMQRGGMQRGMGRPF